jgi:NlpC/P60 family putative phage cell wall peptidase
MERFMTDQASRSEAIVARARAWIGTPYRHQASCRGAGTDCLGLLRGIWRETVGPEPESMPGYTADWAEPGRTEDLLEAARRNLVEITPDERQPGDVLVMRMRDGGIAKHVGILGEWPGESPTLIHAYSGRGVVESPLTPAWARRVAGVFRFPDRSS